MDTSVQDTDWLNHQRMCLRYLSHLRNLHASGRSEVETARNALRRLQLDQMLAARPQDVELPPGTDAAAAMGRSYQAVRDTSRAVQRLIIQEEIRQDGQRTLNLCREVLNTVSSDSFGGTSGLSELTETLERDIDRLSAQGGTAFTLNDLSPLLTRMQDVAQMAVGQARDVHTKASATLSSTQASPPGSGFGWVAGVSAFFLLMVSAPEAILIHIAISIVAGIVVAKAVAGNEIEKATDAEARARSVLVSVEHLVPEVIKTCSHLIRRWPEIAQGVWQTMERALGLPPKVSEHAMQAFQSARQSYQEWHQRRTRELAQPQIQALLQQNRVLDAVRLHRSTTGASVQAAREAFPQLRTMYVSDEELLLDHERQSYSGGYDEDDADYDEDGT